MMMSITEQRVDDVAAKVGGISVITTIGVLQMSSRYGWVAGLQQKLRMKTVASQSFDAIGVGRESLSYETNK